MQELSTHSSSSDGERSEYDIRDHEIAQALRVGDDLESVQHQRPSRMRTVMRGVGWMVGVMAVVAALGFILYGGVQTQKEQQRIVEEMNEIKAFVQFEPKEVVFVHEEFSGDTLKITEPPPV